MWAREGHSPTGEPRHRDKSDHGKNVSQRGVLTSWRAQTEGRVRTRKECEPLRGTHQLESTDGETSQDTEEMQASEGHSHSGEPIQRDKSGHGKNVSQRGVLTSWTAQTERRVRTGKNASRRGALTSWRAQVERQVRIRKEWEPVRGTHVLESPDGETSQDTERM